MAPRRIDMDFDVIEPIMRGIVALGNAMSDDWQRTQRAITDSESGIGHDRLAQAFRSRYDQGTEKTTDLNPLARDPGAAVTRDGATKAIADLGASGNDGLAAVAVYLDAEVDAEGVFHQ
jgi:hypothetical protein